MKLTLLMAMTADGKIAKSASQMADWTSKEDKQLFVRLTKEAGVIIMGRSTFETIGRPLKDRLIMVLTGNPQDYAQIPGEVEYFKPASGQEVIDILKSKGKENAILAGGAKTNELFLKEGLIDEMYLTVEPVIFGKGMTLADNGDFNYQLELLETIKLNDNAVTLHYRFKK